MERYFRALDDYMQDVRRFQEGGRTNGGITDEQIRRFARGKTDKQIARVMMRVGVSVERFARAMDMPVEEVRERFNSVLPQARADNERLRLSPKLQPGSVPQVNQASPRQQQGSDIRQGRKAGGIRDLGVSQPRG